MADLISCVPPNLISRTSIVVSFNVFGAKSASIVAKAVADWPVELSVSLITKRIGSQGDARVEHLVRI